jgi:hypothetical protein
LERIIRERGFNKKAELPVRDWLIHLWRGDLTLGRAFGWAHLAVWVLGIILFQLLSSSLSMAMKRPIGTSLGFVFVAYNIVALVGVFRSAGRRKHGWLRLVVPFLSVILAVLSLWIPVYFYGRPIFILNH